MPDFGVQMEKDLPPCKSMDEDLVRRARLKVADSAQGVEDARYLMQILGLVDEDGKS